MRTLLIAHERALLDREGLARWLASFSTFAGTVVVREDRRRLTRRISRELARVGPLRFLDVLAFRLYYRLAQRHADRRWAARNPMKLRQAFPQPHGAPDCLVAQQPDAIRDRLPDIAAGRARAIDTSGRRSATWGQPWLTAHLKRRMFNSHRSRLKAQSSLKPEVSSLKSGS